MLSIVKQSYHERYDMYMSCPKSELLGFLYARDKYKEYNTVPDFLRLKNYNNQSKSFLAELLAERDIVEMPQSCSENYEM